ncbi:hydantoinase B/oxoprolinase family protein [Xanthobacter flavus]|uniref:hydantoinase B/oxoprolinase family protein n=1 Tax=Xanthobacter flavus TaxID=281 RepID=UPI001AE379A0
MTAAGEANNSHYPAFIFGIDRGGTFTDVVAWAPDGTIQTAKVLSDQPGVEDDAAVIGIRSILERAGGDGTPPGAIEVIRMGTTVGTNALLERRGEPVALLVTRGFRDALRIGYQNRPRLFDLHIVLPESLHATAVEIDERMAADGSVVTGLDTDQLRAQLGALRAQGYASLAIAFMHSYRNPAHEIAAAQIAREAGFAFVAMSHECSRLIKYISRADTAVVDANLTPVLRRYIAQLTDQLSGTPLLFMQSNGGLIAASAFRGKDCVLSGPAGGIVGAVEAARASGFDRIIGFDMGGTSTDVTHYAGELERTAESEIAGVRIRVPTLAIHTVAAGGGSLLSLDGQRFRVGPGSAGANPGPACYRNGGPLTVTDCNLLLGRLAPEHFPRIFGPGRDQGLDADATRAGFEALAAELALRTGHEKSIHDCAEGFRRIALENMANAIKKISIEKGYDLARYVLCSFGGAGGQHACDVADALGMSRVLVHPLAGVLSAYGMGVASLRVIEEESVEARLDPASCPQFEARSEALLRRAAAGLAAQGVRAGDITFERRATLRYEGSNVGLQVALARMEEAAAAFVAAYAARYGFTLPGKAIIVEALSVEAIGRSRVEDVALCPQAEGEPAAPIAVSRLYVDGAFHPLPVFHGESLAAGQRLPSPAMIIDRNATTVVDPGWGAQVMADGAILLTRAGQKENPLLTPDVADPVYLEVFNNRFMAIADQMGQALVNTAHSVNIKERLDFSCAIFDRAANLVSNAPHIPIHLGAMSESVEVVLHAFGESFKPGDVFVLNSPYRGGAHLPDITVIAPVFDAQGRELMFFTASRGHHADVGGSTPGSMPPDSTSILDEGVLIEPTLLVEAGVFLEEKMRALLGSGRYPARNPEQNLADLRAQVAACMRGAAELRGLCAEFGSAVPLAYAGHIQDAAEEEVRQVISALDDGAFTYEHDLGFQVSVRISIERESRSATIDFTGTSAEVPLNFNAPPCITRSAVLYVFRTLVQRDIPLNAGCLRPITIIIPEGSLLNPRYPAAVAAGNPETSVLVTDALFGALQIHAACQGTMNNVTFGDAQYQYYETICGGAGAVEGFDGTSAVHTHMTNSLMTDPEVLELRFPVRLEDFSIRAGSGGAGRFRGGDGTVRRLRFLRPMELAVVTNRRRIPPYGVKGGAPGAPGLNALLRADGTIEPLGSCSRTMVAAGDGVEIQTPGGGGFGAPGDRS